MGKVGNRQYLEIQDLTDLVSRMWDRCSHMISTINTRMDDRRGSKDSSMAIYPVVVQLLATESYFILDCLQSRARLEHRCLLSIRFAATQTFVNPSSAGFSEVMAYLSAFGWRLQVESQRGWDAFPSNVLAMSNSVVWSEVLLFSYSPTFWR